MSDVNDPQPNLKALLKEARDALAEAADATEYHPEHPARKRYDTTIARINAALPNQEQAAALATQPVARPKNLADQAEWLADKLAGNDYVQEAARLLRSMASVIRAVQPVQDKREALQMFVRCAYPVATVINQRGYNWCEAYLDAALAVAQAVLNTPAADDVRRLEDADAALAALQQDAALTELVRTSEDLGLYDTQQAQSAPTPAGYKLVPLELTEAMIRAGGRANSEWLNDNAPIGEARYARPMGGVWRAMLAACPAAASAPCDMGEICIGCEPRLKDGSCPGAASKSDEIPK